jgi:hypothetical protein
MESYLGQEVEAALRGLAGLSPLHVLGAAAGAYAALVRRTRRAGRVGGSRSRCDHHLPVTSLPGVLRAGQAALIVWRRAFYSHHPSLIESPLHSFCGKC